MSTLFIGNNFIPNQQQPLHDAIASYMGGVLVFQGGYHPRKTKHVIRVVFQDQTMYARTSFRGMFVGTNPWIKYPLNYSIKGSIPCNLIPIKGVLHLLPKIYKRVLSSISKLSGSF